MAAKGYPGSYEKNIELKDASGLSQQVFYMGVKDENGKLYSNGGRVLIVVGKGRDVAEAKNDAYAGVAQLEDDRLFHRNDIGWQSVK